MEGSADEDDVTMTVKQSGEPMGKARTCSVSTVVCQRLTTGGVVAAQTDTDTGRILDHVQVMTVI